MSIATNVIRLALLIATITIFLLGQGWLVLRLVFDKSETRKSTLLQVIPLALTCGLITNLGMILVFQNIKIASIVGSVISIIGIYAFVRNIKLLEFSSESAYKWIGAIILCLIFLVPILTDPLRNWDARSIWFFHAKMIYSANSIGISAGWQDPSAAFSHPDYPILVPVLTSQIATVAGFWNEFLPKLSLFVLLVSPILWLFTFGQKSISFAILLLLIPFTFDKVIWNGLMDGYLALYFSVAFLLLGRYLQSSQRVDLISGLCCLVIPLYLKNEGALAALAGICSMTLILFFQGKLASLSLSKINWKYYVAGIIALLPFLLWTIYKRSWGLSNDLEIGSFQSANHLISRIADGSYQLVVENVYRRIEWTLLLLTLLCFACSRKRTFPREAFPALLATGIYCLGLVTVYLLTPYDLQWQVRTSMNRTILSVNAGLFASCYFILRALESKSASDQAELLPVPKFKEESPQA